MMSMSKSYNPIYVLRGWRFAMPLKAGLLICFFTLTSFYLKADTEETIDIELSPVITFDEVSVDFDVDGFLKFETDVFITESNKIYINIEELFRNLGVKCISENDKNFLSGFIENESKTYSIDFIAKQIEIGNKTIHSANGMVKELGEIYIETTVLTEAFGLNIIFNYRQLSIKMEADFELPFIKQMRLEQMRENISKLQHQEIIADTIVKRDYHLFKFGTFDWSLYSYQTTNESSPFNNVIRLGVGTELLFGQVNVTAYYNDRYKWDSKSLYYDWRWVDNDAKIIKQAQLGKIAYQSIAFINAPIVGGSINNSPNTVRKASGFYTISEYTEPNWTVELYINDVLVDYTEADASGLYVFEVPNVYGYTTLTLKFYGPMGEEKIEERTVNVPFTLMPAKTLEYRLSGGILEDGEQSRYGHGELNYGVNRFITIGGGIEYLSSITNSPSIPFANIAIQPLNKLFVSLEYAYDVKMRGLMSYNFGQSSSLEIDYTDYVEGQTAIPFKPNQDLKVRLSTPFKLKKVSGFFKLKYNQMEYGDEFKYLYHQFDATVSGYYRNFNANLSSKVNWISENDPYSTAALSVSYRWRNGLILRPLAEYNISRNDILRCKVEVEKRVGKANFSVSYERNFEFNADYVFVGFRLDLNFARVGADAYYTNNKFVISESAQGSLAFGGDNLVSSNNSSLVGKGGILLYPFLDINQNGIFDEGEKMVLLSNVRLTGGKATVNPKDSIVRASNLNAFINYFVEFSDDDLDNISWQFKNKTYQILVDPNQFKRVDIPIIVMGEADGMVYLNNDKSMRGIGRITIQIFDKKGNKVAETLSESDGYINYLGLKPGDYKMCLDSAQLENLNFTVSPLCREFTITTSEDGDIVGGLDFVLNDENENSNTPLSSTNETSNTTTTISNPIPQEISKDTPKTVEGPVYVVQLLATTKPVEIKDYFAKLINKLPNVQIVETKGDDVYFRYSSGEFSSRAEAATLLKQIKDAGWDDTFVTSGKSK